MAQERLSSWDGIKTKISKPLPDDPVVVARERVMYGVGSEEDFRILADKLPKKSNNPSTSLRKKKGH